LAYLGTKSSAVVVEHHRAPALANLVYPAVPLAPAGVSAAPMATACGSRNLRMNRPRAPAGAGTLSASINRAPTGAIQSAPSSAAQ